MTNYTDFGKSIDATLQSKDARIASLVQKNKSLFKVILFLISTNAGTAYALLKLTNFIA